MDEERYAAERGKAKSAIARMQRAADTEKRARGDRDEHVIAMVLAGGTLGGVASDTGLSKSTVALIWSQYQGALRQAERHRTQG